MAHVPVHIEPPTRSRRVAFSMTPLADVMFQLLIFFMLSTSLAPYALIPLGGGPAAGGGAPTARIAGTPPPAIWQLGRGTIRTGGATLPFTELPGLAADIRDNGVPEVVLLASSAATAQDVATALEILRAARVPRVRLIGRSGG